VRGDDEVDPSNDASSDSERAPSEGAAPLITKVATSDDDIVAALKLVADSVAEQRNVAARVLVLHPFSVAVFTLLLSATMHFMFKPGMYGKLLMTITGLVILAVAFVRQVTLGYIFAAEDLGKIWLVDDQILVSKFAGVVIGALVLGWEKGEGRGNRRKKWGKGIVRAWAVKPKYRGKGVGTELLADAVKETAKRGGEDVIFAEDHAREYSIH
jgi:GNAT superfamily N-acetyltransferase